MIHIVGAGSGAADLITLRGARLLRAADVVVWAGSLVNPELLAECKESCIVYDSAHMTLEEVLDVMCAADARGEDVVRLHTGDPCLASGASCARGGGCADVLSGPAFCLAKLFAVPRRRFARNTRCRESASRS